MPSKPTPGPWIITEDAADCPRDIAARIYTRETDTEDGGAVCDVHVRDEDRANARLIAAAPELLAFVEEFASRGSDPETRERCICRSCLTHVNAARALLAKVRG